MVKEKTRVPTLLRVGVASGSVLDEKGARSGAHDATDWRRPRAISTPEKAPPYFMRIHGTLSPPPPPPPAEQCLGTDNIIIFYADTLNKHTFNALSLVQKMCRNDFLPSVILSAVVTSA